MGKLERERNREIGRSLLQTFVTMDNIVAACKWVAKVAKKVVRRKK